MFGLSVHPDKTKIIFAKEDGREGRHPFQKFTFLGYDFQPRQVRKPNGKICLGFIPAASNGAKVKIRQTVRSWRWRTRVDKTLADLASWANPIIRGWLNYYGKFARYTLGGILDYIDKRLIKWIKKKHKMGSHRKAWERLKWIKKTNPRLFAHW